MTAVKAAQQHYTYADYAQWPDNQRWELIQGEAFAMTAPQRLHQEVVFELARQLGNYLLGKSCKGYVSPFDVRLPRKNEADNLIETVVQPDLSVICDPAKLDRLGCRGAPDWIIEVLSPSTTLRDMQDKLMLYEQHAVSEYWIVHPEERWVMVYHLDEQNRYLRPTVYGMDAPTPVIRFPDLWIDWAFMAGT